MKFLMWCARRVFDFFLCGCMGVVFLSRALAATGCSVRWGEEFHVLSLLIHPDLKFFKFPTITR
jgi:hypothetical protein